MTLYFGIFRNKRHFQKIIQSCITLLLLTKFSFHIMSNADGRLMVAHYSYYLIHIEIDDKNVSN